MPVILRPRGDGDGSAIPGAGKLGMGLFLVSLGVLFAASLVAYAVVRLRAPQWPPPGAPPLPGTLWLSTALLLGCSVAVQQALAAIRGGDAPRAARRLGVTTLLALGFLFLQGACWWSFFSAATFGQNLYGFTFYMLTGLHALHVLGGLILLVVVWIRARRGAYSWAYYPGVRHAAWYWHFLDGVWLLLFALLQFDR